MRVLGIDHGTVRIGIAMSDELKIIAQPLEFIPAEPFSGFLDRLKGITAGVRGRVDPVGYAAKYGWQLRRGIDESARV